MMQSLARAVCWILAAAGSVALVTAAEPADQSQEIQELKRQLADQQKQIEELRLILLGQKKLGTGEVASVSPVVPAPAPPPAFQQPAPPAQPDTVSKEIEGINANLRGFRFSGDFRYRLDMGLRSGNEFAAPLQNIRSRYRFRLNIDKDLAKGLTTHLQLSTGPYATDTTNDQDFAAFGVKHPFSIAEAWVKYSTGNLSVRGGRMEEAFADNSRFLWDDDIRFNGFEARYNIPLKSSFTGLEFRVADYILSNPNTAIVPAGSPYLQIGYRVGQKVRNSTLLHPGFVLRAKGGGWTWQLYGDYSWYRNADQIQLASTAAGFPILASNAVGVALSGGISAQGNALTTPGGALFSARHWQIAHFGVRADYGDFKLGKMSMPFWADFQDGVNAGTGSDRSAYMATVNLGATRKFGDLRFLYQYSHKEANSIISQFTDDDLGTGTGVNTRVNAIRFDLGLTRFLQWQNLVFIQDPLVGSRPGFFVLLPKGANTTYRYLGQLAFSF